MARVIKQGRCDFSQILLPVDPDPEQPLSEEPDDDFNSLSCLVKRDELEPEGDQPQAEQGGEDGEAEGDIGPDPVNLAKEEAERIIAQARQEARRIKKEAEDLLIEAKRNADEIENTAYTLGYEQGHKDGQEIGQKQFEVVLQHLESFFQDLKAQTRDLARAYEAQMIQVALMVAQKVVEREIQIDKGLISRILTSALEKTVEGSTIVVHMNPRDYESLNEEMLAKLSAPGGNRIKILPDIKINRGGCMLETEFGLVDASLESRWIGLVEEIGALLRERTGFEVSPEVSKVPDGGQGD